MKFYIYNLFKGKTIIKQLVTWNEIKIFADELNAPFIIFTLSCI